jgi:hypothetical protein
MGRPLVEGVLLVWVASCAPHASEYHTSVSFCATMSLSPTPRPTLTNRVSELYPGGGFKSNPESEEKFPFPVCTIEVTRPKKVIQLVLRRSSMRCWYEVGGNFHGLRDVFCRRFRILSWRGGDAAPLKHWQNFPKVYAHTPR